MDMSRNIVAVLLILALIFAGIGVGIAVNNYQSISAGAYKEVSTAPPAEPSEGQGQVGVVVRPAEENENG